MPSQASRIYHLRREGMEAMQAYGSLEAWARSQANPVGGWYGLRKGY